LEDPFREYGWSCSAGAFDFDGERDVDAVADGGTEWAGAAAA